MFAYVPASALPLAKSRFAPLAKSRFAPPLEDCAFRLASALAPSRELCSRGGFAAKSGAHLDDSVVPLKALSGIEYKKIVGCYLIHNRENDRYYVGQSKDVMKRLKQHFRGAVPNNVIFAQDYYSSEYEHKEDLFEVKIVPCSTKDELDWKEREYIRQYDANGSGYNSTSGNK